MTIIVGTKRFSEGSFPSEADFETLVKDNSKLLFGKDTIYIDAKKKIQSQYLGATIPDGFLFDLSDKENPEFYLVEVELASHDFYRHIFPQITKFFAYFKNPLNHSDLVEKLFTILTNDPALKQELKKLIGDDEVFKFINDVTENSQNILLMIDGPKQELPEIIDTYSDTWGKMVKVITLKRFFNGSDSALMMEPDFSTIQFDLDELDTEDETKPAYSEEYHLDGVSENVKQIYARLKSDVPRINPNVAFNPQKYYISLRLDKNLCYLKFRKKKIRAIVMLPEPEVRSMVKHHTIKSLSEPVQGYYNGACCAIDIEKLEHFEEVMCVMQRLFQQKPIEGV